MLVLLFEVTPKSSGYDQYLQIAAGLRPHLEKMDGFLFIDRFRSMSRPMTILSHSRWRDEAALASWRVFEQHHRAQEAGREHIFSDYRLRIAQVTCEIRRNLPPWAPQRLTSYRVSNQNSARHVAIAAWKGNCSAGRLFNAQPTEIFESINNAGSYLAIYDLAHKPEGIDLQRAQKSVNDLILDELRICELERDYGMFDRDEAPQYYPPVQRTVGFST